MKMWLCKDVWQTLSENPAETWECDRVSQRLPFGDLLSAGTKLNSSRDTSQEVLAGCPYLSHLLWECQQKQCQYIWSEGCKKFQLFLRWYCWLQLNQFFFAIGERKLENITLQIQTSFPNYRVFSFVNWKPWRDLDYRGCNARILNPSVPIMAPWQLHVWGLSFICLLLPS